MDPLQDVSLLAISSHAAVSDSTMADPSLDHVALGRYWEGTQKHTDIVEWEKELWIRTG
jgi:hypothetical protein